MQRSHRGAAVLGLVALLVILLLSPTRGEAQADPRLFSQTGYRVASDVFWDYFQHRGAVRTFGYPVSRQFTLQGFPIQLFQRAALQQQPDGSVALLNLLEPAILTDAVMEAGGLPAVSPALVAAAPSPDDPDYDLRMGEFLRAAVPDTWEGRPVGFGSAFFGTVTCADAFPRGGCQESLLPLLNLEIWGAPTSTPRADPNNADFFYQRFQRGILHWDAACDCTQALLLGDLLKSLITGHDLPAQLESAAAGSPYLRQYDPSQPLSLARPAELAATDLTVAFLPEAQVGASPDSAPAGR